VVLIRKMRNMYRIHIGDPESKSLLRRTNCRGEANIKLNRRVMGFGVWIGFIWLRIRTSNSH
jgi:hypothetical protein